MPFDNPLKSELALAHEQQVAALTDPELTEVERVKRFAEAAGFDTEDYEVAMELLRAGDSAASAVWHRAPPQHSLFGSMPRCQLCPVQEIQNRHIRHLGIPAHIPHDWHPTSTTLEAFARVQQKARHAI